MNGFDITRSSLAPQSERRVVTLDARSMPPPLVLIQGLGVRVWSMNGFDITRSSLAPQSDRDIVTLDARSIPPPLVLLHGLGFRVWVSGFRESTSLAPRSPRRATGLLSHSTLGPFPLRWCWFRVWVSGFGVECLGFGSRGLGFRVRVWVNPKPHDKLQTFASNLRLRSPPEC